MPAGDFVVPFVLECPREAEVRVAEQGIQRRRSTASFRENADGLGPVAVVGPHVEQISEIERVALPVQRSLRWSQR